MVQFKLKSEIYCTCVRDRPLLTYCHDYYYWIHLHFVYLQHPLLNIHLHALGSIVYCSNSCSFAATNFLLSSASASPSPSSLLSSNNYIHLHLRSSVMSTSYIELVYGLMGALALER